MLSSKYIKWYDNTRYTDVSLVGGKNASLGELTNCLTRFNNENRLDIKVPIGFSITTNAFKYFLEYNNLENKIIELLKQLDKSLNNLSSVGDKIRNLIISSTIPPEVKQEIIDNYKLLTLRCSESMKQDNEIRKKILNNTNIANLNVVNVAVRSSATCEDSAEASFAGQLDTYLNIRGQDKVLNSILSCYASLFTDRAICYRIHNKIDHITTGLSVGIQEMCSSDLGSSGVMFTIDTETGFNGALVITSSYGLGENVVQGSVNVDEFLIAKETLKQGYKPIISKKLGSKKQRMVYNYDSNGSSVKNIDTSEEEQNKYSLNDDDIINLAKLGVYIEQHYSKLNQDKYTPMDIEFGKSGNNKLYCLQARFETVQSKKQGDNKQVINTYKFINNCNTKANILCTGISIGNAITSGKVKILQTPEDEHKFNDGDILVTRYTSPDWEPIMKKSSAIITASGSRCCHAAIIAREMNIPAVVGTGNGIEILTPYENKEITLSSIESVGKVYEGKLQYECITHNLSSMEKPNTAIMINLANPESAFDTQFLPNSGVGLLRVEFAFANQIKVHPMALIKYHELKDKELIKQIDAITIGYDKNNKKQYLVDKLASCIGIIATAFYPKPVIVRFSDFKSNEYKKLLAGLLFELDEENPMIGFRGCSRYYHDSYREAFALECEAFKLCRNVWGLTNVIPMFPFCRTINEGKKVLQIMADNGLRRGENGLQVYMMCEIPSNVILINEFCELFDGFSIGSNDLTQLTLGIDRDSELLAPLFDETNEAVTRSLEIVIKACKKHNKKIGICGQCPSDNPEFAKWLVEKGIDSMSLISDVIIPTSQMVAKFEQSMKNKQNIQEIINDKNNINVDIISMDNGKDGLIKEKKDLLLQECDNQKPILVYAGEPKNS